MGTIKGSGLGTHSSGRVGLSEEEIRGFIAAEAAEEIREATPELFRMVKAALIELFDDRYAALSEVVVVVVTIVAIATIRARGERSFQYWDFDNMKPPEFYGGLGPD